MRTAVEAYRDAIEKDGLATWILIDDWESPAEIRALLKELYEDRRMPLEGTVFVGDIPVPMIRECPVFVFCLQNGPETSLGSVEYSFRPLL